jgi:DNA invertase Pin-like site-specific DNA recombinase
LISTRTRQALAAAKARGITLGNPKLHVARRGAVEAVKAAADRYAANVLPIIREAQKAGATTLRDIANALNARGVATARGGAMARQVRQQTFLSAYRSGTMLAIAGCLLAGLAVICVALKGDFG